jgi:hypothetical protein
MVKILCTHVLNEKVMPVKTIPGIGEGGMKKNGEGGKFKFVLFDIL